MLASSTKHHTSRRLLLAAALLGLAYGSVGCAPADEPSDGLTGAQTFSLQPSMTIRASRNDVQLDRIFLGIGSIYLEPLDDPSAPVISAADSLPLTFTLDAEGQATLFLPEVPVTYSGRYEVSIGIEPLPVPVSDDWPSAIVEGGSKDGFSVLIQGQLIHDLDVEGDPLKDEPEPLPWRVATPKELRLASDGAVVEHIPFEYQSDRTGFIRLGEVKLGTDRDELHISIDLNHWLDAAIVPVMDGFGSNPVSLTDGKPADPSQETPFGDLLDLNEYEEIRSLDLEHVFGTSRAEAR